ncbi:hypothetical protein GCM10009635_23280 [Actinocatenispora thailandica]
MTYAGCSGRSGELRSASVTSWPGPASSRRRVCGSSHTTTRYPSGTVAANARSVTTTATSAPASSDRIRAGGWSGSTGTYAAPDLSTPSTDTTRSAERSSSSATRSSGPTPRPMSSRASRFAWALSCR